MGANKIINVIAVTLETRPTGGYQSQCSVTEAAKTLTALCQEIIQAL